MGKLTRLVGLLLLILLTSCGERPEKTTLEDSSKSKEEVIIQCDAYSELAEKILLDKFTENLSIGRTKEEQNLRLKLLQEAVKSEDIKNKLAAQLERTVINLCSSSTLSVDSVGLHIAL